MSAPTLLFELENLGFSAQGRPVIHPISTAFEAGKRYLILGANGAGKSVLMRLCHGILDPTMGEVRWAKPIRQAMVFQRPVMLRRSALANVLYGLSLAGVRGAERHQRAVVALERVGLARLAHQPAQILSGGEQQRLALARAWALEPSVLFLDEPTAALDPTATSAIEAIVMAIHATGTTVVMSTHNLAQAQRVGEEVLFLNEGHLVERANVTDFFNRPQSAAAAAFLRSELLWN